jgi:hypothetical protein
MVISGQLLIQKDGSILRIEPRRTLAMGDGSRVNGEGEVITPDNREFKLTEGQRLVIAGPSLNVRP